MESPRKERTPGLEKAPRIVVLADLLHRGYLERATFSGEWATRMETAATRWIDQGGNISSRYERLSL